MGIVRLCASMARSKASWILRCRRYPFPLAKRESASSSRLSLKRGLVRLEGLCEQPSLSSPSFGPRNRAPWRLRPYLSLKGSHLREVEEFFPLGPLQSDSQSFLRLNGVFLMRRNGLVELMRPARWMEYPQAVSAFSIGLLSRRGRSGASEWPPERRR